MLYSKLELKDTWIVIVHLLHLSIIRGTMKNQVAREQVAVPFTENTFETDSHVESPEFQREHVGTSEHVESLEIQRKQENFDPSTSAVTETKLTFDRELNSDLDLPILIQ